MLCYNLKGWDEGRGGREVLREGTYVNLWLIHADVWQKSSQYCKVIILQLKKKKKESACQCKGHRFNPWSRKILEKAMAIHSSTLAWKIPWTGEPGGLPSMGSHRVGHD